MIIVTPVPEGVSVVMRGPEKIVTYMVRGMSGGKKIECDWLESWCGPINPRWPPRWRLFLSKMPIPLLKAAKTCFSLRFELQLSLMKGNRYQYTL